MTGDEFTRLVETTLREIIKLAKPLSNENEAIQDIKNNEGIQNFAKFNDNDVQKIVQAIVQIVSMRGQSEIIYETAIEALNDACLWYDPTKQKSSQKSPSENFISYFNSIFQDKLNSLREQKRKTIPLNEKITRESREKQIDYGEEFKPYYRPSEINEETEIDRLIKIFKDRITNRIQNTKYLEDEQTLEGKLKEMLGKVKIDKKDKNKFREKEYYCIEDNNNIKSLDLPDLIALKFKLEFFLKMSDRKLKK